MKKFMILLVVVALVLAFASTAFAGVPGDPHPFGREFGDLASKIARGGPDSIFAAIRAHF